MPPTPLILDQVLDNAAQAPDRVYLTQPVGGGQVVDYTWAQVVDQARRMAAHLQSRGFARGARDRHPVQELRPLRHRRAGDLDGGYTTVAIFPTETADTMRYVLEHSEASLLFVGKLDTWPQQTPACRPGCRASPSRWRPTAR